MRWSLCILLAVAMTGCLANVILLQPPDEDRPAPGAEKVQLPRPDGALEIIVARSAPDEPAAFVLRFYGNAELANGVAREAEAMRGDRIEWWGVNYPGYGGSAGPATLDRVATAARDAYTALARRANGRPIIVIGTSLGGAVALHVAATQRVSGVVLLNPVPLPELLLRRYGWFNLWLVALPMALQIPDELDSVANAERATAPAVFLSALDDGIVPASYQRQIIAAYAGDIRVIDMPGRGHNDQVPEPTRKAVSAQIRAWIRGAQ